MFNKLTSLFSKSNQDVEAQSFMQENQIIYDMQQGYIVEGVVLNQFSQRLEYFSNRRINQFDDLKALYDYAMIINEKIDLEIAQKAFVTRLGNTEENLKDLKRYIKKLNNYYRQFLRDK